MQTSNFIHFSDIELANINSWYKKAILSIDIDWAEDAVLLDTISILELSKIKATFFVTHYSSVLERVYNNPLFEIGIHPNFDPLLRGDSSKSAFDIVRSLCNICSSPTVLRSHAMTTSGRWIDLFQDQGITHISNYFMYGLTNITPFAHINGLIEAPVFFADDGLIYQQSKNLLTYNLNHFLSVYPGLQVYNFHPIHLFLNTESLTHYSLARSHLNQPSMLLKLRSHANGPRDWLNRIIKINTSTKP